MLRMSRLDASYHHGNLGPVLEAAGVELLAQKAHTSISLRELAREADVSHNAPYHHFGDKAGLFKRLGEVSMQRLVDQFAAADEPGLDLANAPSRSGSHTSSSPSTTRTRSHSSTTHRCASPDRRAP